ncbi:MAG TPA: extracellular solute-binding protein [Candidatus Paceibacterota bacterium]
MNNFQTIVLGIFGFFIIAGLLAIATVKARGGEERVELSVWGSAPSAEIEDLREKFFGKNDLLGVSYRSVPPEALDQELLEALAAGRGPDLLLLPAELLLRFRGKLLPIPYTNYSERQFRDTFIQEGDLFLLPEGIAALPFSLDPLVMYWNRDFLDEAGIATPPRYWDEFLPLANNLTLKDELGNISRSAVALGEYRNIAFAKELLSALFLQSGNPIFAPDSTGAFRASLGGQGASAVLDFYTEFANPLKPVYSWNRSLPLSTNSFLSSKLAVYFGFGSEYAALRKGNPNLNFDVAVLPRPRNATVGITYGRLVGVALLRTSRNPAVALQVAYTLASPQAASRLHAQNGLPPVERALLANKPTDPFGAVMYDSAARSRGFLDPDPRITSETFKGMVESVTSGRERSGEALSRANSQLQAALR